MKVHKFVKVHKFMIVYKFMKVYKFTKNISYLNTFIENAYGWTVNCWSIVYVIVPMKLTQVNYLPNESFIYVRKRV